MRVPRTAVILILLCLVLIGLDKAGLFSWPRQTLSLLLNPVQVGWYRLSQATTEQLQTISQIGRVSQDNLNLRAKNDELAAQIAQLSQVAQENTDLKTQLGTPETKPYQLLEAQTLGFVPVAGTKEMLLSVGQGGGVKVGQVVVKGNVVLGKITGVEADRSTLRLLTDPQIKVVVTTNGGAKGILVGQFESSTKMTQVLQTDNLKIGDTVLISGEDNWPKNFVVGQITKITKKDNALFQEADVQPLVSYDKLQTVFIIVGSK